MDNCKLKIANRNACGTFILAILLFMLSSAFAKSETIAPNSAKDKAKKIVAVPDSAKKEKKEKEETTFKFDGVLEVGFDINNKLNKNETEYKKIGYGQIGISARPVKKIRAEFGLEYKDKDSALTIDKLYGQYNFANWGGIRVGYMKKSWGLEERAGVDERYFHKRSIINDELEYFGLLGHDLTFQYRHKIGKEWKLAGGFSWAEDTLRFHQNYSVEYETKTLNVILAAIIGHYTHKDEDLTAFATSFSFKHLAGIAVSEAELTFGNNPAVKYLEERSVYVFGARVQENFPIPIKTKFLTQVTPIAEAALFSSELESDNFDLQLRAGLTFGFAKKSAFQWRNTYGTVLRFEDDERELHRRRFDSEVVVVF